MNFCDIVKILGMNKILEIGMELLTISMLDDTDRDITHTLLNKLLEEFPNISATDFMDLCEEKGILKFDSNYLDYHVERLYVEYIHCK